MEKTNQTIGNSTYLAFAYAYIFCIGGILASIVSLLVVQFIIILCFLFLALGSGIVGGTGELFWNGFEVAYWLQTFWLWVGAVITTIAIVCGWRFGKKERIISKRFKIITRLLFYVVTIVWLGYAGYILNRIQTGKFFYTPNSPIVNQTNIWPNDWNSEQVVFPRVAPTPLSTNKIMSVAIAADSNTVTVQAKTNLSEPEKLTLITRMYSDSYWADDFERIATKPVQVPAGDFTIQEEFMVQEIVDSLKKEFAQNKGSFETRYSFSIDVWLGSEEYAHRSDYTAYDWKTNTVSYDMHCDAQLNCVMKTKE